MTEESDLSIDMIDHLLDEYMADAIVGGWVDRETVAPELQRIVQLADVARSPALPEELADEDGVVDAFLEVMGAAQERVDVECQRRRRLQRRAAKAVAAMALVALTGTAAAATNHLPDAVQAVVSDAGSHVGLHLPKPNHEAKSDTKSSGTGTDSAPSQGQGPDATGPAKGGLCTAHAARGTSPSDNAGGVAEQNLQAAAATAGQTVDEFCADSADANAAPSPEPQAPDDGTASDNTKSNENKPADPGGSGVAPPASDHPNNGKQPVAPNAQGLQPKARP
ncbi:MAG: hypothetical protein QOI95_1051 [Acidimicrobiaceae bacterium]|jgi:hypothetical protein